MSQGIGRLVAAAAIFIFLFVGVGVIQAGYWDASTDANEHVTFDESPVVNEGNVTALNESNRGVVYAPVQDVNISQSGSAVRADGNWTWNRHNGTIEWAESTSLTNGSTVNVSYFYTVPSTEQNVTKEFTTTPLSTIGAEWYVLAGLLVLFMGFGLLARVGL